MQEVQALSHGSQVLVLELENVPIGHTPTQFVPLKYPILQLKQIEEFVHVLQGALHGTH